MTIPKMNNVLMDFMIKFCKIMKNISQELINTKNKK